jgi:phosphatidylglycerophosphatase A
MKHLAVFVATSGYVGYFPLAPGTAGSAAGLALYALLRGYAPAWSEIVAILVLLVAGVWAASVAEHHFARKDPGPVVVDEVMGMLVTLAFMPLNATGALVGFLVFRVFDVIKPWPAGRLEALPRGLGVMADDLAAGVYANFVTRGLTLIVPGLVGPLWGIEW